MNGSDTTTDDTEWVCMPCWGMVPNRSGHVTVHGEVGEKAAVWCPWCGDKMERAAEVLTENELRELQSDSGN